MNPSLLVIEDEPVLARNVATYLGREGFDVRVEGTGEAGLAAFAAQPADVVLVDYQLPGMDGLEVVAALKARAPGVRVIVMTGNGDEGTILAAFRSGAADYLKKPLQLAALGAVVAGQAQRLRAQAAEPPVQTLPALAAIVGDSAAIARVRSLVQRLIGAEAAAGGRGQPPSVLITGETGTGKELVARALHEAGPRSAGPFVEINCAAIPATMIEAELFGHERGAFTDARERRAGLVETAAGGTLFLDEVGCMDLAAQAKLLRVLEDRRLRRLGGVAPIAVDARFVAATSADLEEKVRDGRFRADLYYRLGMLRVRMPALREREGDVLQLAAHFLRVFSVRYGRPGLVLAPEAREVLSAHRWPGNVRELRNVIEQAVIVGEGTEIRAADLDLWAAIPPSPDVGRPGSAPVKPLELVERHHLSLALKESGSNVSKAARILGISRDTLRYRIRKHGLELAP